MHVISIQKGHYFEDEGGAVVGPFEVFKCSSAYIRQQGARNPKLLPVEDYLGIIAHRPDQELRQLAKNAGLDGTLPVRKLKEKLQGFAKRKGQDPDPQEPDQDEMNAELLEMTVNDLRELASNFEIPNYTRVRKEELVVLILDAMKGDDEQ